MGRFGDAAIDSRGQERLHSSMAAFLPEQCRVCCGHFKLDKDLQDENECYMRCHRDKKCYVPCRLIAAIPANSRNRDTYQNYTPTQKFIIEDKA